MRQFFAFLASLPGALWTWLTRPAKPTSLAAPTSEVDVAARLAKLILSQTESIGPMPGTGGVIHAVGASTAANVATLIVKYAALYKLPVSFLAATIRSESDFDPGAIDPNDQDVMPGETADATIGHTDAGLAQGDVSSVKSDPMFAGLTDAQIEIKLLEPEVGVELCAKIVAKNLAWAEAAFMADPSLKGDVPNADPRVLAAQAYNSGQTGAIDAAREKGLAANWGYGLGLVTRADTWAPLLDVA